ncbi:MAG: hypothetical protein [Olavius algarvensis spirochete endosymbiont]|nr:MAG: hypothetical protein [Olavius algarvensis spirochete endosymbiont]
MSHHLRWSGFIQALPENSLREETAQTSRTTKNGYAILKLRNFMEFLNTK